MSVLQWKVPGWASKHTYRFRVERETREQRLERHLRMALAEAHAGSFPGDPSRRRCTEISETLEAGLR